MVDFIVNDRRGKNKSQDIKANKYKDIINHLEIALSWLENEDNDSCFHTFCLTEVGWALLKMQYDEDITYWLVKEDFYHLMGIISKATGNVDVREQMIECIKKMIERFK